MTGPSDIDSPLENSTENLNSLSMSDVEFDEDPTENASDNTKNNPGLSAEFLDSLSMSDVEFNEEEGLDSITSFESILGSIEKDLQCSDESINFISQIIHQKPLISFN